MDPNNISLKSICGTASITVSSKGNDSEKNSSETAGQRLYLQALASQRKLEEARKSVPIIKPQLQLSTRRHGGSKAKSTNPSPRYLQLYEHAKAKMIKKEAVKKPQAPKVIKANEGMNRLYALSISKQQEGKERREEIMRSKIKKSSKKIERKSMSKQHEGKERREANMRSKIKEVESKKISLAQATNIYERGMEYLISKEIKRIEEGMKIGETYESKIVAVEWTH